MIPFRSLLRARPCFAAFASAKTLPRAMAASPAKPQKRLFQASAIAAAAAAPEAPEAPETDSPAKRLKFTPVQVQPLVRQHETITLSPAEQLLRELVLDCRADMRAKKIPAAANLEIWVTGGWVRDKLLGVNTADVDLALSTMTGGDFGNALTAYYQSRRQHYTDRAAQLGVAESRCSRFKTTKENPGKSKHLETAIGRMFGLDVDLVNLRKEVYASNSRTPEMQFGTAEEDALRRDATVNALFFDLDAQQVVDLTRRGLDDMQHAIMRTPLPPRQTFMDDPLRVLRLIRMSSKLGYTIDPEAREWMAAGEVQQALHDKVSRERFGLEVLKMFRNRNPQLSLQLILDLGLWESVFLGLDSTMRKSLSNRLPPENARDKIIWPATWARGLDFFAAILQDPTNAVSRAVHADTQTELPDYWLMAAYTPLTFPHNFANRVLTRAVDKVASALRLTAQQRTLIENAYVNRKAITDMVDRVASNPDSPPSRQDVGMAIRSWANTWRLQVVFTLLAEVVYLPEASIAEGQDIYAPRLQRYSAFFDYVEKLELEEAYNAKPLINGHSLMSMFSKKAGNWIKNSIDAQIGWQFDHPDATKEDARQWLWENRYDLKIT